jgi:two-component system sensor histidine kinase FlrB
MALAEVSTILAHEIRNPLASMELFAGLIAEDRSRRRSGSRNLRAGIRLLSGPSTTCSAFTAAQSRISPQSI